MIIVNSSNVSKELKRLNITEGDLSLLFNASENAVLSFLDKTTLEPFSRSFTDL